MKYVVILGDGMADYPVKALGGKTPLMAATKPHIDRIAKLGRSGLFTTVEPDMEPGSEVANLSVLGYDARAVYQGRGVLEAASMGVELDPTDVAMRVNLICLEHGKIKNHSAGHIPTEEGAELIRELDRRLGNETIRLHPGVSYRHLLVLKGSHSPEFQCFPPHDHVGRSADEPAVIAKNASARATADLLNDLVLRSRPILEAHPVNRARVKAGKDPGNSLWPWSPGRRPDMPTLHALFGITGSVISAVDLIQGLGKYAGLDVIKVPGATGLHDTNYEGKAQAALDALERRDFVYVHVEASDEAGHSRDLELKIRCIEYLDPRLVRLILEGLETKGMETVVAVLPDHATPVELGTHVRGEVPVAIWDPREPPDGVERYDEVSAGNGSLGHLKGADFMNALLGKTGRDRHA